MTQLFLHSRLLTDKPTTLPTPSYLYTSNDIFISHGDSMTMNHELMLINVEKIFHPATNKSSSKSKSQKPSLSQNPSLSSLASAADLNPLSQYNSVKIALPEIPDREQHLLMEWHHHAAAADSSLDVSPPPHNSNICSFLIIGGLQKQKKKSSLQDCWKVTFDKSEIFSSDSLNESHFNWETIDGVPKLEEQTRNSVLKSFSVERLKDLPVPVHGHSAVIRRSHYAPQLSEIWLFGGVKKSSKSTPGGMFLVWKQNQWNVVRPNTGTMSSPSGNGFSSSFPDIGMVAHSMEYRQRTDSIVVFGGYSKGKYCNDVWEFHCMTQEWQKREQPYPAIDPVPRLNLPASNNPSERIQSPVQAAHNREGSTEDDWSQHSAATGGAQADYSLHRGNSSQYLASRQPYASHPVVNQQPQDGVPNSATLVGSDLLVVHEFSGNTQQGSLFVLNLDTSQWQTLKTEGCSPDAHSFYRLMRCTPRKFLLVGKNLYMLEVMQNLKKIKDISEDLQTQISTKDLVINLLDSRSQNASTDSNRIYHHQEEDNEFVRAYKTQRESLGLRSRDHDTAHQGAQSTASALCHKVVMMQSQVLREKINNSIQPTSIHHQHTTNITLQCPKPLFDLIVQYLYGSHPALTAENVIPLMAQAQRLRLDRLRDYCLQRIVSILSSDNIIHCVSQAFYHKLEALQEVCLRFINKNYLQLLKKKSEFSTLPSPVLYRLMCIREGIETLPPVPRAMNTVTNPLHALQKHIAKIKKGGYHHDFVLRSCDGRSFRVHRAILVVKSPYFVQIIKESKTSKHIFIESQSDLVINGKLLNIILDDVYGLFIPSEGNAVSRSLNEQEMMDLIDICIRMQLATLLNAMLSQLSNHVNEENAIELLEFAIHVQKECSMMPEVTAFNSLKEACMSWIRKPETDFEYGMMMSKFFEAKMEFLSDSSPSKGARPNGGAQRAKNKIWTEVFSPNSPRNDSLRGSQFGGENPTDLDSLSFRSTRSGAEQQFSPRAMRFNAEAADRDNFSPRSTGQLSGRYHQHHYRQHSEGIDADLSSEISDLNLSNY